MIIKNKKEMEKFYKKALKKILSFRTRCILHNGSVAMRRSRQLERLL